MLALGAVDPEGVRVVDHDGEDGDLAHGLAGGDGLVARVDSEDALVDGRDGQARVVKVGLRHRVVAAAELELDHGADGGGDLLRRELERAVGGADRDDLDIDGCESVSLDCSRVPPRMRLPYPEPRSTEQPPQQKRESRRAF